MKQRQTILFSLALLTASAAWPQSPAGFRQGEANTANRRVSSNGRYLVGERQTTHSWGLDSFKGFESFLTDLETGETEWLTEFGDDYTRCGSFTDVSDDKTVCGVFKDPEFSLTVSEMGYEDTLPLNVAAVWKEGKVTSLGLGTYSVSDFDNFADGSFASCISSDGRTVGGYVAIGNYAVQHPCVWTLGDGGWAFRQYAVPEGVRSAAVTDVSGDGSLAVGYAKCSGDKGVIPCYWTSPDECVLIDNGSKYCKGTSFVVSDSGEYIACSPDGRLAALYIVGSKVLRELPASAVRGVTVSIGGITDSGNMVGTFTNSREGVVRPFWYSYAGNALTDFDYYMYLFAPDTETPYSFGRYSNDNVSFSGMSAAGDVIVGNDTWGKPWCLVASTRFVTIPPGVDAPAAYVSAPDEVSVSFARGRERYMQYTAKEYVVYRNSEEAGRIPVEGLDKETKRLSFTDKGVEPGVKNYSVAVNYTDANNGGAEFLSPKSREKAVYVTRDLSFPLYDDFDSGSISTNGWFVERERGEFDYQNWGCPQYQGFDATPSLYCTVDQEVPYSYHILSRMIDASDRKTVYMSFARKWQFMNSADQPTESDSLSIELSSDGFEWKPVKDYALSDLEPASWNFEYLDLTELAAGKVFQVRLRVHGEAKAKHNWQIENLRIDEKPAYSPAEGLKGNTLDDGTFRLSWKNTLDAYPLNYLGNYTYNSITKAVGNEGKPLICVNRFTPEDLRVYRGKRITSVSTTVNRNETQEPVETRIAIVVYEDGKLIREQEITDLNENVYTTYPLEDPVIVSGDKEMMVGLKVLEHAVDQLPVVYHNTGARVSGKSDLYSEDGGKTWLKFADVYKGTESEMDGWASWLITPNLTDGDAASILDRDENVYGYEVYKNGELYSTLFNHWIQAWFEDARSTLGDSYQVRTHFVDGHTSPLSEAVVNDGNAAVATVEADGSFSVNDGLLSLGGATVKSVLYTASGLRVAETTGSVIDMRGLGRGLYVVKAFRADGSSVSAKILL